MVLMTIQHYCSQFIVYKPSFFFSVCNSSSHYGQKNKYPYIVPFGGRAKQYDYYLDYCNCNKRFKMCVKKFL